MLIYLLVLWGNMKAHKVGGLFKLMKPLAETLLTNELNSFWSFGLVRVMCPPASPWFIGSVMLYVWLMHRDCTTEGKL